MKSLLMDTSNRYLVIAAYEDGKLLTGIQEEGSKKQSEYAIPYIENVLNQHHLELFDFDEIIVTRGPGSYTGLRIAEGEYVYFLDSDDWLADGALVKFVDFIETEKAEVVFFERAAWCR